MAVTQLNTSQVKDGTVTKADLNITTVGQAVVTRIVAGSGVTLSQTGIDTRTGEVTINATGGGGGSGLTHPQIMSRLSIGF